MGRGNMIILSRVSNFADLGETDDSRNSGTKSLTNFIGSDAISSRYSDRIFDKIFKV